MSIYCTFSYPPTCPPPAPTNVEAVAGTTCSPEITVTWDAPAGDPKPLNFEVTCSASQEEQVSATVDSQETSATLSVLASLEYTCSVVSVRNQGRSSPSPADPVTYRYVIS